MMNKWLSNTQHRDISVSFYAGGLLYGALEKDTTIRGNYTALVQALFEHLDLNSHYLRSNDETPVLLENDVTGYYEDGRYYTGIELTMTTSQEVIRIGNTDNLQWHMEAPTNYQVLGDMKDSHATINLPSFIKLSQ